MYPTLMVAIAVFAVGQDNFPEIPKPTAKDLRDVAQAYSDFGLPYPPSYAPLVVYSRSKGTDSPRIRCGYRLPGGSVENKVRVLAGTHTILVEESEVKPIVLDVKSASAVVAESGWSEVAFEEPSGYALVAIELRRGHDAVALRILQSVGSDMFSDYRVLTRSRSVSSQRASVAALAVLHWVNEALKPGYPRKLAADGIALVIANCPEAASEWTTGVLRSMTLTVDSQLPSSDPKERLIDALTEVLQDGQSLSSPDPSKANEFKPLIAIAEQGYDIAPNLIAHLDDDRLTRSSVPAMNNGRGDVVRVGQVCGVILDQYRGKSHSSYFPTEANIDEIKQWWAGTRPEDEAAHCLSALTNPSNNFPPDVPVYMASKRHPEVLLQAYQQILQTGANVQTYSILEGLERSAMDRGAIVAVAIKGCQCKNKDAVHAALWTLHRLRSAAFPEQLVVTLDSLPPTEANSRMPFRSSRFAQLAAQSDDPEVWEALARATKRAEVDLRLEMLQSSQYSNLKAPDKKVRFRYWRQFFDDRSMGTDTKPDPDIPSFNVPVHYGIESLRIDRMARVAAAQLLDHIDPPSEKATDAVWDAFCKKVDVAVAQELGG